jgi:excisionase family DNA binding protein
MTDVDQSPMTSPGLDLRDRLALSVEEAGSLLGISRDLAYDLVAQGQLPSVRLGRRLVVPRRALEAMLEEQCTPWHNLSDSTPTYRGKGQSRNT